MKCHPEKMGELVTRLMTLQSRLRVVECEFAGRIGRNGEVAGSHRLKRSDNTPLDEGCLNPASPEWTV
jgi:hypothetical protein